MKNPLTEKCLYITLISVLTATAIILPIIVIKVADHPLGQYVRASNLSEQGYYTYLNDYMTLTELRQHLKSFVKYYNDFYKLSRIGRSHKRNTIYKIEMEGAKERDIVLVVSGIQGNDWKSVQATITLMDNLVLKCGTKNPLLRKFDFHFIPLLNPDGYEISLSSPIRRKWVKNYDPSCRNKYRGANLLYNFAAKWKKTGSGDFFPGEEAFSEPESKAFSEYFKQYKSRITAVFFLFSHQNIQHIDRQTITVPLQPKAKFFGLLVGLAIEAQIAVKNSFTYVPFQEIGDLANGRIDSWVIDESPNKNAIKVVNINANFRRPSSESKEDVLALAIDITTIIDHIISFLP